MELEVMVVRACERVCVPACYSWLPKYGIAVTELSDILIRTGCSHPQSVSVLPAPQPDVPHAPSLRIAPLDGAKCLHLQRQVLKVITKG